MKISVIIAVYNDPDLKKCLKSIFKSENVDFEVIVVDDGSEKVDIEKIISDFPETRFYKLEINKGPAYARNFGAKLAKNEIVFFIDSDAQVYKNTLSDIIKKYEEDNTVDGVTITWSDEPVKDNFFNKFKAIETNYITKHFWKRSFGSNGSSIFKDIFLKEGGFDENFKTAHAEDFYLGLKLFGKKYNIILDKENYMKNAYLDNFLFDGMKKYSKRAFLRAIVLYQLKNKTETSYNSFKFKVNYLLSLLILFFNIVSISFDSFSFISLLCYILFIYLNKDLYKIYIEKYKINSIFYIIFHYIYILTISISGVAGLIYSKLFLKPNTL